MRYVVFYESADDVRTKAPLFFAAHRARLDQYHEQGTLLMVGPFGNPEEGAMAVLTSREAAEEFVRGDAFVLNGVVRRWYVREWHDLYAS